MRYNYIGNNYLIDLIVDNDKHFNMQDSDYLEGKSRFKPLDFNLHLALNLLEKEHLPPELLETLEQWARDNKMVVQRGDYEGNTP